MVDFGEVALLFQSVSQLNLAASLEVVRDAVGFELARLSQIA